MKQNYQTVTNPQNSVYSFQLNTFWIHVTMNGDVGTDQHGDKWFLRNGKLCHDLTYWVIPVKNCFTSKKLAA